MPNMNPQQISKLMKSMGIKSRTIPSTKVIIECEEGNIVIKNPGVTEIEMQGQKSYQITGNITKEEKISEEDLKMVIEQTGADEERARKALEDCGGGIAEAILKLKE